MKTDSKHVDNAAGLESYGGSHIYTSLYAVSQQERVLSRHDRQHQPIGKQFNDHVFIPISFFGGGGRR